MPAAAPTGSRRATRYAMSSSRFPRVRHDECAVADSDYRHCLFPFSLAVSDAVHATAAAPSRASHEVRDYSNALIATGPRTIKEGTSGHADSQSWLRRSRITGSQRVARARARRLRLGGGGEIRLRGRDGAPRVMGRPRLQAGRPPGARTQA